MQIYILTDFEGAAAVVGQVGITLATSRQYDSAQRIVTAEINAAVRESSGRGRD